MANEPSQTNLSHDLIAAPIQSFITINSTTRPWHMPLVAALAISSPVFIGAYYDNVPMGLLASLGAMVILNLPYVGTLLYRMVVVLTCSFGMVACFAVGLIAHSVPILVIPLTLFITFWVTIFSRCYRLSPPAGLFIIMASALAFFMPVDVGEIPYLIGVVALGTLIAGMVGCCYTLCLLYNRPIKPAEPRLPTDAVLSDSIIMAVMIASSLAVALLLNMPKPYWVPMSCYVVMQGINFKSIWIKHLHRIVGTGVGIGLAWVILDIQPQGYSIGLLILGLVFFIETLVVRHYAAAVIFVTPLTIMLAEYSTPHAQPLVEIISVRLWDTVLGCFIGVIGGLMILSPTIKQRMQVVTDRLLAKFQI